jgi:hypothetical protein
MSALSPVAHAEQLESSKPRSLSPSFGIIIVFVCVTQVDLELSTLLHPECWDYRHAPRCPAPTFSVVPGEREAKATEGGGWGSPVTLPALCRLGVCVLHNCIYAAGGYDGQDQLNSVERYDVETEMWTFVAPMKHRRSALGITVHQGRIYVLGEDQEARGGERRV